MLVLKYAIGSRVIIEGRNILNIFFYLQWREDWAFNKNDVKVMCMTQMCCVMLRVADIWVWRDESVFWRWCGWWQWKRNQRWRRFEWFRHRLYLTCMMYESFRVTIRIVSVMCLTYLECRYIYFISSYQHVWSQSVFYVTYSSSLFIG